MTDDELNFDVIRVAMAEAMHKADCGCPNYQHSDDAYYDMFVDAAIGVIRPELERLRGSEVRQ